MRLSVRTKILAVAGILTVFMAVVTGDQTIVISTRLGMGVATSTCLRNACITGSFSFPTALFNKPSCGNLDTSGWIRI